MSAGIRNAASAAFIFGLLTAAPCLGQAPQPLISELRLGTLAHDQGFFSSHQEAGADINGEALFGDLGWLGKTVTLRPHLGISVNTAGRTSQAYLGLTATAPVFKWAFIEGSVGGAIHDGNLDRNEPGHKDLGCRVLFRESLGAGIYLGEHSDLAVEMDHISNANLCARNAGLESVGIKYGYRF